MNDHERQCMAIQLWNQAYPEVPAVYVQRCDSDEFRVSDINASIRGYVDVHRRTIQLYGETVARPCEPVTANV